MKGERDKKAKPKRRDSWPGWAVVLNERNLRCVFGKDERLIAENEADRYLGAEVVRVVVTRATQAAKKKRSSSGVQRELVRRPSGASTVRRKAVKRRNRGEES